jgi:peptidyl-prolyl cis-trans isomerase A (cyclophilin A)
MRNIFLVPALLSAAALAAVAQSSTQAAPAAKPPVHHAASRTPIAVIKTTVGNMTCTLFPDKAPIGVANFIGLANGTKDWKNPVSGATEHGKPLYDGTIFHRVIPEFMIQGGDA